MVREVNWKMIIVIKSSATPEQLISFTEKLKNDYDVRINRWDGIHSTVLGLIGDTTPIDIEYIEAQDIVESVKRVQEPYKKANRKFHPENTAIKITDTVTINNRVHFGQIAHVLNMPIEEIRILNPQYRQDVIPGNTHPYTLCLPSQQVYSYIMSEDSILAYHSSAYNHREVVEPGQS